jgi:hypothetical protein
VQSAVLDPSLVVSEFLDGSSDWIVGISPNENVTVTIDWVGDGTFFKGKTYFLDLFKVILSPNSTP